MLNKIYDFFHRQSSNFMPVNFSHIFLECWECIKQNFGVHKIGFVAVDFKLAILRDEYKLR